MLLVQDYLLTHSLGQLASEHGVYARFDKSGRWFSLNYDMIEAKDDDPIACECRGLVLTTPDGHTIVPKPELMGKRLNNDIVVGETKVAAFGFRRFFNLTQGAAAKIDFEDPTTRVCHKLDGTLCLIWQNPHTYEWSVGTRSVPDADLPIDNFPDYTFRTLFERAFKETMGIEYRDYANKNLDPNCTYMFELTTPYNKVVCVYNDFRITLLGARDLTTMKEFSIDPADYKYGLATHPDLPRVKSYSLRTPADIIKWVGEQNPLNEDGEGVVVLDKNFNRVKIKNPAHGLLSRAKDKLGSSIRNCLELALSGHEDDFVAVLPPEIVKNILDCKEGVRLLLKKTDEGYSRIVGGLGSQATQKDFALAVQASGLWQTPCFKMRAGKVNSTREFIESAKKDGEWSSGFLDTLLELIAKA